MRSERVPAGPKMSPKTLLGTCGPILAYCGGRQARNFSKSFWAKIGQFFPNFFFALFRVPKGLGPSKTQNWPCRPPMDPILAHFVGKKAKFGVKNHSEKNVFLYKMTFLGSSDHFSSGAKWFWYLQNDKMYTLRPTESPGGVRNGPRRAKNGPQTPTGPAHFGLF